MVLFDDTPRVDLDPARYAEPRFSFLNRSARDEFVRVRQLLEDWFARYPGTGQGELRSRFRSTNDRHHQAALFELFLHELLLRLNCTIEHHPTLEGRTTTPDFLVTSPFKQRFYLEATIVTEESAAQSSANSRANEVYDAIDRWVKSPNFFVWLGVRGAPATPPPARKIARAIDAFLADLDPDQITEQYELRGNHALPRQRLTHDGWDIVVRAIPKKPDARKKSGVRPLGMRSTGFRSIDHRTALRDAIIKKAGKYGQFDLPCVIAVNALDPIDTMDIEEALFGKEQYTILFDQETFEERGSEFSRIPDGAWTSRTGPRYTRVSGVLVVTRLFPSSIPHVDLRLYHNPWAKMPLEPSVLPNLTQFVPIDGEMRPIAGETADVLFGLSQSWPEFGD